LLPTPKHSSGPWCIERQTTPDTFTKLTTGYSTIYAAKAGARRIAAAMDQGTMRVVNVDTEETWQTTFDRHAFATSAFPHLIWQCIKQGDGAKQTVKHQEERNYTPTAAETVTAHAITNKHLRMLTDFLDLRATLEYLISASPTGDVRNRFTEVNILIMQAEAIAKTISTKR
jgi:hypothetical protein